MPRTTTLEVRRTERLTPHMIRVVAGGGDIADFPDTPHTDRYVKIVFPRPGRRATPSRSTWRRSAPSSPASSGPPSAPTRCARSTAPPAS